MEINTQTKNFAFSFSFVTGKEKENKAMLESYAFKGKSSFLKQMHMSINLTHSEKLLP